MQIAACRRRQATAASTPTYARRSASRARSGNGTPFVWCGVLWAARIFLSLSTCCEDAGFRLRAENQAGALLDRGTVRRTLWILYGYSMDTL